MRILVRLREKKTTQAWAVVAVFTMFVLAVVTLYTHPGSDSKPVQEDMAACTLEDGSTQPLCVWDDGTGRVVVNLDFGSAAYYPDNNTFVYFRDRDGR